MNLRQYAATQADVAQILQEPPAQTLVREQVHKAQEALTSAEVYKKYQEAIKTSEQARTAITKGLQAGLNPYRLLLTAVDCIGKLTGDTVFSSTAHDDITLLYGEILREPQAAEIELEEVETRLAKLRSHQGTAEESMRVQAAIRQHEHRAQELRSRV